MDDLVNTDEQRKSFEKMMHKKCPKYTLNRLGGIYEESTVEAVWNGFREGWAALEAVKPFAARIEALEAALKPEYVVVPREPTVGMLRAMGCTARLGELTGSKEFIGYCAMIAALHPTADKP